MAQCYRAAVGAFIINEDNQLLITRNFGHKDKWFVPRGGIEKGELEEQALRRELYEEIGIHNIKILMKSKISTIFLIPPEYIQEYKLNYIGQAQNYYWAFLSKTEKIDISNDEVEEYKWIDPNAKEIAKYFKQHDDEQVIQTLLPRELNELLSELPSLL